MIEPFGDRLATLNERYSRSIDILYHNTPQHPHGTLGEFDMFCTPQSSCRNWWRGTSTFSTRRCGLNILTRKRPELDGGSG